ncbi:MAG: hypothetical protein ACEPO8_07275 [Rhodothermaceae bacterium]
MDKNKALEDLAFVKNIIEESNQSVIFGRGFIVWGVLIAISLIATYTMIKTQTYSYISWWWCIVIGGGWLYEAINWKKSVKRDQPRTFIDKIIGKVWLAMGISASIIGISGMFFTNFGMHISALISLVLAVAYLTTGELLKKTYWRYFAGGWWAVSIVMLLWPGVHTTLIMAGAMVAFQIVPGIIIQKKINFEPQD